MDIDRKIEIAEKLTGELTGIDRNEFSKWINSLKAKKSLDKAITLAEYLSTIPMLRPLPKRSYERICEVMKRKRVEFQEITLEELLEILGFTRLLLVGETASLKGAIKGAKITKKDIKKAHKDVFRKSNKGYKSVYD